MNEQSASSQFVLSKNPGPALLCAAAGGVLFQFFGNATQGYIHTRSLFEWWGIQWFDPAAETQHGLLIALVAVWLFWRNLRRAGGPSADANSADRPAALALLSGLALHLAGFALQQTRFSIAGFLLFLWGVLALAGGRRWARAAAFPLGYMLLAIPVSFVDTLGFHLRLAVSAESASLAQHLGIRLLRNGTQLVSPDGFFQYDVAAACSGIRSLMALVALALLMGYVGLRTWFPRLALTAACLPFVVIGNIARVLFIIVVSEKFGREASGTVHDLSGYVGFAVILGLLLALLAVFRRLGSEREETPAAPAKAPTAPARPWRVALLVVAAALATGAAIGALQQGQRRPQAGVRLNDEGTGPVDLPGFIGTDWIGRRIDVSAVEREVLPPDTGYARRNYVLLSDVRQQVFVSVVLSGRDRTSIHRPELCLVGQGWSIVSQSPHTFPTPAGPVPATLLRVNHALREGAGPDAVAHSLFAYWFVGSDSLESTHLAMQRRDLWDRLRRLRADRWAYLVVQTIVNEGDEATALKNMEEVVAQVWPRIRSGAQTGIAGDAHEIPQTAGRHRAP